MHKSVSKYNPPSPLLNPNVDTNPITLDKLAPAITILLLFFWLIAYLIHKNNTDGRLNEPFQNIEKNEKFSYGYGDIRKEDLEAITTFARQNGYMLLKTVIDKTKYDTEIYEFLECGQSYPHYKAPPGKIKQTILLNPCHNTQQD